MNESQDTQEPKGPMIVTGGDKPPAIVTPDGAIVEVESVPTPAKPGATSTPLPPAPQKK